jgi:hypothetical protein
MIYVERLTELNLIPLVYDREKDIILYFKCKNNFVDLDISQYVETTASRTRAGTSCLLRTALCRTSTFQNLYFVRIIKLLNYVCKSAPPNCYATLSNFKTYLHKTYLHLTPTTYTLTLLTNLARTLWSRPTDIFHSSMYLFLPLLSFHLLCF